MKYIVVTGGVMSGLGDFAGGVFGSDAYGVSADGSVVVGFGKSESGGQTFRQAFRWTTSEGVHHCR